MFGRAQRMLLRIGRWPRRIAALICLVLAGASAVVPHPAAHSSSAVRLRPGEVAVPVQLARLAPAVRPADEGGGLAPPADGDTAGNAVLVADHVRVVSVEHGSSLSDDNATTVVVAADRAGA